MIFAVVNLGCKVNRVESDVFCAQLVSLGHEYAESPDADVVIVNTCTVTGEAEKKTRKTVRQTLKRYPKAQVIVTGCAVAINPLVFEEMGDRVEVVLKADMEDRLALFGRGQVSPLIEADFTSRTRRGVKVQDGCDNACTYCIVHVARGRARSRDCAEIIEDVLALHAQGVREIVLSGINIGSYDFDGMKLADLLEKLLTAVPGCNEAGVPSVRFRISSVEPMDLDDRCIEVMAQAGPRICAHLHLPLQSGSTKVLREMARPYDAEDFRALIKRVRAGIPQISLSTDVIVGFPGESEEDFADTLELVEFCGFSKVHVFPYSMREGTPAAARSDQVPAEVKATRAAELRALSDRLRAADYEARRGCFEFVLIEGDGIGMTESYYEIDVPRTLEQGSLERIQLA